ncbi:MAG: hypothetical protein KDE56_26330 [Anaerolineales bacterium]|nr:hypothetical protein [Anaerolineales bacterium]
MSKKGTALLSVVFLLAVTVLPALAQISEKSVNLPGWVGFFLVLLAVGLAVGTSMYIRNR